MKKKRITIVSVVLGLSLVLGLGLFLVGNTPRIIGQNPNFDGTAAEEEGYWYSRYNLGNLVMRSGLGGTFMPTPEMIGQMVKMADADPSDGDTAMPPQNAALLQSVYASGDPHYITKLNVDDFGTQRWDPNTFDKTVTARAMGWTIMKEVEWAKQFHVDDHFGTPTDNFGAQWRFVGLVLSAEAKMQAQYAINNLMTQDGLFADSNGTLDWSAQWVLLEAFSDLGATLQADVVPHSGTNRYADPAGGAMFIAKATALFDALANRQPADGEELSLAIQSLVWYATYADDLTRQNAALSRVLSLGDELISLTGGDATQQGFRIRGLIEAYRVSGHDRFLTAAAKGFESLSAEYSTYTGIFRDQSTYRIDDVATIMGALNSLKLFAGGAVDQDRVEEIFTGFYESAVDLSGLQQSVPGKTVAKGTFEQGHPDIYYTYPGIPLPPMAGGKYGVAPVFATEVRFDGSTWTVTDGRFDTAGAMHASNEFIWFHNDEVNGFPQPAIKCG